MQKGIFGCLLAWECYLPVEFKLLIPHQNKTTVNNPFQKNSSSFTPIIMLRLIPGNLGYAYNKNENVCVKWFKCVRTKKKQDGTLEGFLKFQTH